MRIRKGRGSEGGRGWWEGASSPNPWGSGNSVHVPETPGIRAYKLPEAGDLPPPDGPS